MPVESLVSAAVAEDSVGLPAASTLCVFFL